MQNTKKIKQFIIQSWWLTVFVLMFILFFIVPLVKANYNRVDYIVPIDVGSVCPSGDPSACDCGYGGPCSYSMDYSGGIIPGGGGESGGDSSY